MLVDYTAPANNGGSYFELGVILNYQGGFGQFFGGTPVNDGNGIFTVAIPYTVTAADSYSYFEPGLIINSNFDSGAATSFTVDDIRLQRGSESTFSVTTTGFPAATLSETGALPSGVSFNTSTGLLSGIAGPDSGGTYVVTFTADNGVGSDASQVFTLSVDQSLAFTSGNRTIFGTSTANTFSIATSGFPTATLTEKGKLPSGVTFTNNGDGTATLAGTPASNASGVYPITVTAADGSVEANVTQVFTLTVSPHRGAGYHQRQSRDVCYHHGQQLHGYQRRLPDRRAERDRDTSDRPELHGQRRRQRHDRRDGGFGHDGHVHYHAERDQRRGNAGWAEVYADGRCGAGHYQRG